MTTSRSQICAGAGSSSTSSRRPSPAVERSRRAASSKHCRRRNAEVIGVSSDRFDRQCEFAASLDLTFPLVSDEEGDIARLYDAKRLLTSLDRRITYIIDPDGKIAHTVKSELDAGEHEKSVMRFFEERGA